MEIKLSNVTTELFSKINFTIPKNKIIGVTGNSRYTFIDILMGKSTYKGNISYDGEKLSKKNILEIQSKISYIDSLFVNEYSKFSIEEYLNYLIMYNKLKIKNPRKKIIDSLKIVNLKEEYLTRSIDSLSFSEKRKFQLAVALITNPKVIILDEFFTGLDNKNIQKLSKLMAQLNEKFNITIIIISINSEYLYRFTNYLVITKDGKVLKRGNSKVVYEDVDILLKEDIELPDIVSFTYRAKIMKNVGIDYHRDIRDLIKDIYKHV